MKKYKTIVLPGVIALLLVVAGNAFAQETDTTKTEVNELKLLKQKLKEEKKKLKQQQKELKAKEKAARTGQPVEEILAGKTESKKIEFGNGIKVTAKDSSYFMKFSARIQNLLVAETDLDGDINLKDVDAAYSIRRARLKFDGFAFSPKLKYKLELGLSNHDLGGADASTGNADRMLLDAVLKWNFYENFELWAGQTKLPGNRERVISSQELQFVERSLLNARFNIDRDLGVQLRHHINMHGIVVREAFSISQGEGRNVVVSNRGGLDFTGRIELLPMGEFADYSGSDLAMEEKPKLALGFTYDFHDNAVRERGQLGDYMTSERDLESLMADLMFKYKGISLMAEWLRKGADFPVLYDTSGTAAGAFYTGTGFNLQAGYVCNANWEVALRYTQVEPEDITSAVGRNFIQQYTLGVSKYIAGHNLKVQGDISYTDEANVSDPGLMVRLQVEMAF